MKVLLFVLVMLVAISVSASAAVGGIYFAQDDFIMRWTSGLGSIGTTIVADGDIAYPTGSVLGTFDLTGTQNVAVLDLGWGYKTTYDATLTIKDISNTVLWNGTGSVYTIVNKTGGPWLPAYFDATGYDHPAGWNLGDGNDVGPYAENFRSIGAGSFDVKVSGTWSDPVIAIPWLGTYDWRYIDGSTQQSGQLNGNMQGKLQAVPEPMSVMLGLMGLGSIAGLRKLRKK